MQGKVIAYYRVSTQRQGKSGLGLDAQRAAVEQHAANNGSQLIAHYTEVESGKRTDRPQLQAAMDYARLTGATLVVAKLDRLSRNAAFLNTILDSRITVAFADMPFADRFTIGIMAQVAQWESEQISKRTKEALTAAKARGTKLGGSRGDLPSVSAVGRQRSMATRSSRAADHRAMVWPHVEAARTAGHSSLSGIARYLNGRHITTAQGGKWFAASVARLTQRQG